MSSAKAKTIERDIEKARLLGNWGSLTESARRYKKHEPNGAALQTLILAEAAFNPIIGDLDNVSHENDNLYEISMRKPLFNDQAITEALTAIKVAMEASASNLKILQQASILKAKANFCVGEYSSCLEILTSLNLSTITTASTLTGYSRALHIQGLCYEKVKENISEAIRSYEAGFSLITQTDYPEAAEDKTCIEFQKIIEDSLFRLPLLQLRSGQYQKAVGSFRQYFLESGIWSKTFRTHKQLLILRYYLVVLAHLYQRGEHIPCPKNSNVVVSKAESPREELSNIQTRYETLIYTIYSFPEADITNFRVLDMADQFVSNWGLLKNSRAIDTRNLVDSLYRAAKYSYHSPRILRHLTTGLIALGDYEEAQLAMEAYVQRIQKGIEVKEACILDATQDRESFSEFTLDSTEITFRKGITPSDKESFASVIETYITGARLCIQEFSKYDRAIELSELAISHCKSRPSHHLHLKSRAFQYLGVAKGYLSMKADNPATRTKYHEQSLDSLHQAVSVDGDNWEGHFFLGLQQAEGRDIKEAILSVKRCLELQSSYTPAWHLLVLLLSSQKQLNQALNVCELSINEAEHDAEDNVEDSEVEGSEETTLGLLTTHLDGEDLLSLKVTLNLLQDSALGTKLAINHHGLLFALYAKVYGSTNSDLKLASGNKPRNEPDDLVNPSSSSPSPSPSSLPKPLVGNSTFPRVRGDASNLPKSASVSNVPTGTQTVPGNLSKTTRGAIGAISQGWNSLSFNYGLHVSTRSLPRLLSRRKKGVQVLVGLWLLSSEAYRKLGRYEDARLAVEEAEQVDAASPDVWCQYGKIFLSQKIYEASLNCLQRAILLEPEHVQALTALGQYYLELNQLDQAESYLRTVTSGPGWSSPTGWYLLGKVYRLTQRASQAKSCMLYALDLNLTAPVRQFSTLWCLRNLSH